MYGQIQASYRVSPRAATEPAFVSHISDVLQSYKVIMLCSIAGFSQPASRLKNSRRRDRTSRAVRSKLCISVLPLAEAEVAFDNPDCQHPAVVQGALTLL